MTDRQIISRWSVEPQVGKGSEFTDFNDLATNSSLGIDGIKRQVGTVVDSIAKKAENRSQQQAPEQRDDRVVYRGR